jgi:pimeloyl-ACP methyl ester carboxylesterase
MTKHKIFETSHNTSIAYHYHIGRKPTVIFFGGFMSDMEGTKATALEKHCVAQGYGFLRFDYSGHGKSSGKFVDGTIGLWTKDAISLIEAVVEGPIVMIGSSMGGWTGLLAALRFKDRLKAFIGIAAAPDFTERLMWKSFSKSQKQELRANGQIELPSDYSDEPYILSYKLIKDGRKHLLLDSVINLDMPVRLIHGEQDSDVPVATSHIISSCLSSQDVEIILVKAGGHSLSEPKDLKRLMNVLDQLMPDLI